MREVILYGNGCPKCKVIKSRLEKEKIKFIEKDDSEKLQSLGYKSYPVLEVDEKFMEFASAYKWINERSNGNGN